MFIIAYLESWEYEKASDRNPLCNFADERPDDDDDRQESGAAFTVCKNADAGLNGDVDIAFTKSDNSYSGTLYLPGGAYYMKIKGRGNTTWNEFDKKPYNITFYKKDYSDKKKAELIEGVDTKKRSILANAKDPTCLCNKVGYDIAEELGLGLPSRSVDVWMNGEFPGNYLLTPKDDYQAPLRFFRLHASAMRDEKCVCFHSEQKEKMSCAY